MLKGILQNDLFYCNHLGVSENDERDILSFTVKDPNGEGLVRYLQYLAFPEEEAGTMRTYIVRDNFSSELVGYFSVKAGLISVNEVHTEDEETFDTIPGVEIANFAVNDTYLQRHSELKGTGLIIFNDFIVPVIQEASKNVGVKIIYIFALPFERLINRYREYGFLRLDSVSEDELHKLLKPNYDENCIFMFQQLR